MAGRRLVDGEIIENVAVAPGTSRMRLRAPEVAALAEPGQFVHLRVNESPFPLLRRPFSIFDADDDSIGVLYRTVGGGTKMMSARQTGTVSIMGPLGTGFRPAAAERHILVAGGIGVAAVFLLARRLRDDRQQVIALLGAARADQILCEDELSALGVEVRTITDDGSNGRRGLVTELLGEALDETYSAAIYACGPTGMWRPVAEGAASAVDCQVSLETKMACGTGICHGCAFFVGKGADRHTLRICVDGPVFSGDIVRAMEPIHA